MAELVSQLVYLIVILAGIWGLYALRREKRILGLGISLPAILVGSSALLRSYNVVSVPVFWAIFGTAMLAFQWFVYESTGREQSTLAIFPIFFGWFTLLLVELYVFFFSPAILFAYTSTALVLFHSYDLSKTDLQARALTLGKLSRKVAGPFFAIDSSVRPRTGASMTSQVLFAVYFAFEMTLLILVPIAFMALFVSEQLFYILNLAAMAFVLLVRWQIGYDAQHSKT